MKQLLTIIISLVIGSGATFLFIKKETKNTPSVADKNVKLIYPLKATLYRFELNKDSLQKFNEWMKWHYDEYDAIIQTLEREKMYSESIFRDTVNQKDVIYWLTIDGEGGAPVDNSPLKIDSVHNAYMKACIKKGSRTELKTEFYLIPEFLKKAIAEHQSLKQ